MNSLEIQYEFHHWDFKDQPDWTEISELVKQGLVYIYEIDTQSDCYVILLSSVELNDSMIKFLREQNNV